MVVVGSKNSTGLKSSLYTSWHHSAGMLLSRFPQHHDIDTTRTRGSVGTSPQLQAAEQIAFVVPPVAVYNMEVYCALLQSAPLLAAEPKIQADIVPITAFYIQAAQNYSGVRSPRSLKCFHICRV